MGLAALVPFTTFQKFKHCEVLWSVKWSARGLMPIKPQVCSKADLELPGDKAVTMM